MLREFGFAKGLIWLCVKQSFRGSRVVLGADKSKDLPVFACTLQRNASKCERPHSSCGGRLETQ